MNDSCVSDCRANTNRTSSMEAGGGGEAGSSTALPVKGVIVETNMGALVLELYWDHAPKTCRNFHELAKKGYYNGVLFHRIVTVPYPFFPPPSPSFSSFSFH